MGFRENYTTARLVLADATGKEKDKVVLAEDIFATCTTIQDLIKSIENVARHLKK